MTIDDPLAPLEADGTRPAALAGVFAASGRLRTVPVDAVSPNARQPRLRVDEQALQALADSIRARGVLQPPVVRELAGGGFELIAGERRWRAARLAGLVWIDVLVRSAEDSDPLQDALVENVMREDLSPVEQARAYATLIDDLAITREELGRRLGASRASISNHLRLLDLPDEVLGLLDTGELSFAHGRALLLCDDHATRRTLARRAIAQRWSTRQLENAARGGGAPRARAPQQALSADHEALARRLEDALGRATGISLAVRACVGDRFTFTVCGHVAAQALATRLGVEHADVAL